MMFYFFVCYSMFVCACLLLCSLCYLNLNPRLQSLGEYFDDTVVIVMAENEGLCILGLPQRSSFKSSRRTVKGARGTNGTWYHYLCNPGGNARYLPLFTHPFLSLDWKFLSFTMHLGVCYTMLGNLIRVNPICLASQASKYLVSAIWFNLI